MPVLLRKNLPSTSSGVGEEILRRLRRGESETFLYVVPTKRKIRELQRTFLSEMPRGVAPSFHLFTFETLAAELHTLVNPPKRVVSGPVQGVLMLEAIRSVEEKLSYVRLRGRNRSLPHGTFQKILHVVNYLKERGIYLPVLHDEIQHADVGEQAKLLDIARIYEAYENLLGSRFIDVAGILKEVNDRWNDARGEDRFREKYLHCNALFVSGFDEFSDPELTMLYHCSEIQKVGTLVSFDYHPENDEVFGHLKENFEKLLGMGFHRGPVRQSERSAFQGFFAWRLFQHAHEGEWFAPDGAITIARARDRAAEVELVAKAIKQLVAERPERDLNAICVSMVQPQLYTQLFREVFARYEIPANITDRYNLHQSPVVVSVMSFLALPERNYQLGHIMRALSSPYLRFGDPGAPLDAGNIYAVASMLKISGDRGTYLRRIDEHLASIQEALRHRTDDAEIASLRRDERMLVKARTDLNVLFSLLDRFEAHMIPGEFRQRLLSTFEHLHLVEAIIGQPREGGTEIEVDARAYQKFIAFIDEFLEILTIEGKGETRQPLSFYTDRLRQAVAQERFNIRQRYGYGVNVTSFDETRGLNFEVMFMVGLIDGEFPSAYQSEVFFSASRREHRERYFMQEQRYLFYQALTNFTQKLFLTYPRTVDEKESVPSSFLDALQGIVDVGKDVDSFTTFLSGGIYSRDELLRYAGEVLGQRQGNMASGPEWERIIAEVGSEFEHMRLAMSVERSRISGPSMPAFNGIVGEEISPEAKVALETFRHRVYSVTQLESYGKCPFQFFADRILRLNVIPEPEEELTPVERGELLHEIFFEFYCARRERGAPSLLHASDDEFSIALDDLTGIAKRKLEGMRLTDNFREIERDEILGSARRQGILREFLGRERNRETATSPAYFEASFGSHGEGTGRTDPLLRHPDPILAGNVRLRGKIDRIELGTGYFSIIDYKTGKHPGRKEIDLGISLQLPLYLYAVEKILSREHTKTVKPAAGSYYVLTSPVAEKLGIGNSEYNGTAFPKARKSNQLVADDAGLQSVIDKAVAFVNLYVDTIAKGRFPVEPKDPAKVCVYCDFQTTCRIQLRRPVDDQRSGDAEKTS